MCIYLLVFFRLQNTTDANQLLSVTVFRKEWKSWSSNWKTSLGSVRDELSRQKPWNKEDALEGLSDKNMWVFLVFESWMEKYS